MSAYILPVGIALLFAYAASKGSNVYDAFVRGASQSLPTLKKVLPCMAAMLIAINVFRASGALDFLTKLASPVFEAVFIPKELAPLILLRPFSGSAALALLADTFSRCGVDSFIGLCASLLVGSTETIFYTVALYFGSAGISKPRYSVAVALISGVVSIAASIALAYALF